MCAASEYIAVSNSSSQSNLAMPCAPVGVAAMLARGEIPACTLGRLHLAGGQMSRLKAAASAGAAAAAGLRV